MVACLGVSISARAGDRTSDEGLSARLGTRTVALAEANRTNWRIRDAETALREGVRSLGLADAGARFHSVELVVVENYETPVLESRPGDAPIWHVTIGGWSIPRLETSPVTTKDPFSRTVEMVMDPETSGLLRIRTRWPDGAPRIAPEPGGECVRMQIEESLEIYHRFCSDAPVVSFARAVRVVQESGGPVLVAKQIMGECVVWSYRADAARPVWMVTLRGIPPIDAAYPQVAEDARNHLRYVVDATTGKWLRATTTPQPCEPRLPGLGH